MAVYWLNANSGPIYKDTAQKFLRNGWRADERISDGVECLMDAYKLLRERSDDENLPDSSEA